MKNTIYSFLLITLFSIIFYSCKEDDACKKDLNPGLGGNKKVSGLVRHHSWIIPDAKVFVKFGAIEFPGNDTSVYDLSILADSNAYYEINGLKSGDYYLYSEGFDYGISLPVDGGVPLEICEGDSVISRNIPVTEEH